MATREQIHQKLKQVLESDAVNQLKAPLVNKINCINKGDFNKRFDVRVAKDEKQLGNWWRHPIYVLAKPGTNSTSLNITLQPQRWPSDTSAYAQQVKGTVDTHTQQVSELIKKHSLVAGPAKAEVKTDGKFVLSISVNLEYGEISDADYAKFAAFFADLATISVALSESLPVLGGDTTAETEEKPADEKKANSETDEDEEDDGKGYPHLGISRYNDIPQEVTSKYSSIWLKPTASYCDRLGVRMAACPEIELLTNEEIFPVFSAKHIETIRQQITNNKVIPTLNYLGDTYAQHSKAIWWVVPFSICREDIATLLLVDKNGIYAMLDDNLPEASIIVSWDNVHSMSLEEPYDEDVDITRLYINFNEESFLSIDELTGQGSYLSVLYAIYQVRKATIEASKGKDFWIEGAGGEEFVEFNKATALLTPENWMEPCRPVATEYGATEPQGETPSEDTPAPAGSDSDTPLLTAKETVLGDAVASIAFIYLCVAGSDGHISEEEKDMIVTKTQEWLETDISDRLQFTIEFWKSLDTDTELATLVEAVKKVKSSLPPDTLDAFRADIIHIINADGKEEEVEKSIAILIFTHLED